MDSAELLQVETTKGFNQNGPAPAFVPLLVLAVIEDLVEVRRLPPPELQSQANVAADEVAANMDAIIRDNKPRTKAEREEFHKVWKAVVRGVAIMSLVPGGIDLLGQHFDSTEWPFCGAS